MLNLYLRLRADTTFSSAGRFVPSTTAAETMQSAQVAGDDVLVGHALGWLRSTRLGFAFFETPRLQELQAIVCQLICTMQRLSL